jgi:hypothetical protein
MGHTHNLLRGLNLRVEPETKNYQAESAPISDTAVRAPGHGDPAPGHEPAVPRIRRLFDTCKKLVSGLFALPMVQAAHALIWSAVNFGLIYVVVVALINIAGHLLGKED